MNKKIQLLGRKGWTVKEAWLWKDRSSSKRKGKIINVTFTIFRNQRYEKLPD